MKLYVLTKGLNIGYIDSVCTCEDCKKRGKVEFTIRYDNDYMLSKKTLEELLYGEYCIAISKKRSVLESLRSNIMYSSKCLCEYLESELLNKSDEKIEKEYEDERR